MANTPKQLSVLITGCSSGIGEALAKEFHCRGYRVIATARRLESIRHLDAMGMEVLALDITKEETIEAAKASVQELTGGHLDILVNNGGFTVICPLTDTSHEQRLSIFNTNVFGTMAMVSAFLPLLVTAKGLVVNVSSTSSVGPFPFRGLYAMTKAAITSYGRTLAVELSPFKVQVLTLQTGYVKTSLSKRQIAPLPDISLFKAVESSLRIGNPADGGMSPEEYARTVVSEIEKRKRWSIWNFRFGSSREWLWLGTNASPIYWFSILGESVLQYLSKKAANWDRVVSVLVKDKKL